MLSKSLIQFSADGWDCVPSLYPGPPPSAHLSGRTLQPRGGRGALQPGPRGALGPAPVRGPQSPGAASLLEAKAPGEGGLLGGLDIVVCGLVAEHRLYGVRASVVAARGLSSYGSQALDRAAELQLCAQVR